MTLGRHAAAIAVRVVVALLRLALGPQATQLPLAVQRSNASGVVAAVFLLASTFQQQAGGRVLGAHEGDDAAHQCSVCCWFWWARETKFTRAWAAPLAGWSDTEQHQLEAVQRPEASLAARSSEPWCSVQPIMASAERVFSRSSAIKRSPNS